MGAFSIWHWIIVLIVVLILFGGKGKLSSIMGDFGKGLKNFKDQIKSNKQNTAITNDSKRRNAIMYSLTFVLIASQLARIQIGISKVVKITKNREIPSIPK